MRFIVHTITDMKRFFKGVFIAFLLIFTFSFAAAALFLMIPSNSELNKELLVNTSDFLTFYDRHDCVFASESTNGSLKEESFNEQTKKVFIEAEDRNFYYHKGLDFKRMVKALLVNLSSLSFKEGASTISQQLIKNTHLTSEKSIKRKLKEIKLAQKLEKEYSKDEILSMYLNTIYFGEGNYGLPAAAKYYFKKNADELTLAETATLAAIIPSPSKLNPCKNIEVAKKKRNALLKTIYERGKITKEEYEQAISERMKITEHCVSIETPYLKAALSEIAELEISPYALKKCKIYTYFEEAAQKAAEYNALSEYSYQAMSVDNETLGITAFYSDCGERTVDPASTVKPFLVYAPALSLGVITPYTLLDNDRRDFSGYSPANFNNVYGGKVSATEALSKSYNVPAVELLEWTGVDECKDFARKLGVKIGGDHLSIALGSIGGIKIKQLCTAYASFANLGEYAECKFIRKIVSENGVTLYENDERKTRAFDKGTASLVTEMLTVCAKSGTAKKVGSENRFVAAKTGTAGDKNGNTDALCVAYTPSVTVAAWFSGKNGELLSNTITGGGLPAAAVADITAKTSVKNENFSFEGVEYVNIDKLTYEETGEILVCPGAVPERYSFKGMFLPNFKPEKQSEKLNSPAPSIKLFRKENSLNFQIIADGFLTITVCDDEDNVIFKGNSSFSVPLPEKTTTYYYSVSAPWLNESEKRLIATITANTDSPPAVPDDWWIN